MKALYTAHGTVTGGREGTGSTSDKNLDVRLVTPKELGGAGGTGTNPEQLFAVGYSACFLGALKFVASKHKIAIPATTTVEGSVGIGERDDKEGFGIAVELKVTIPGMAREQAEDLVHKADVVCPYSHATRGNIPVAITVA